MNLGILLTGDQITLEETNGFARDAEEAGLDTIWVNEFIREAFVPLTAIALSTSRIRIGAAVVLAMARSPVLTELAAASVDELSHGRFVLGVGPGPKDYNENWHAVPFRPAAAYVKEYAEVLRLMWTAHSGKTINYAGKHLQIIDYQRHMRPLREQIPVHFGATMPQNLRAAGSVADGLILAPVHTPAYLTDVVQPNLEAGRRRGTRAGEKFELSGMVFCASDDDRHTARQWTKGQIAFYCTLAYYDIVLERAGFSAETARIREAWARGDSRAMVAGVSEAMVDAFAIAGTPSECRTALKRYAGVFDEVILYPPSFGMSREDVVKNYRALVTTFRKPD